MNTRRARKKEEKRYIKKLIDYVNLLIDVKVV